MDGSPNERRILILSDDEKLSAALELNLQSCWITLCPAQNPLGQSIRPTPGFDLLIVALSSFASEPIVVLSRSSLTYCIGQIPILIISDRPFPAAPEEQISHLDFPFNPEALRNKVKEILDAKSAAL